jgi:hypothetical protein
VLHLPLNKQNIFFMVIENLLKSLSFVSAAGAVDGNRLGYFMLYIKIFLLYGFECFRNEKEFFKWVK